jgi:Resolvase, N terminal domain
LRESLDTTTRGGRLVFHVFAALAEFIRELILSGTREGLAAARPAAGTCCSAPDASVTSYRQAARHQPRHPLQEHPIRAPSFQVHGGLGVQYGVKIPGKKAWGEMLEQIPEWAYTLQNTAHMS